MKNLTQHKGKLEVIRRLPSSRNGNPRWLVKVDGWTARTAVDAALGYSIRNFEGKQVVATIGTHYGSATVDDIRLA